MAPKARKVSSNDFSKSEYEVVEILSGMSTLIAQFEFASIYCRGKGTRTAVKSKQLTVVMEANGPLTSNPDIPLDICPKQPKEKAKHFKRKPSKKRKREELSAEIVNLNQERESLMAELLKLRLERDELKVINTEHKATRQRKSWVGDEHGKTPVDVEIKNSATSEFPQDNQTTECKQDHHPSTENQTAETSAKKPTFPSGQSNAIDLNALPSAEEYSRMESWGCPRVVERSASKMMAAEARRKRLKKCRHKNLTLFRKTRCIFR